MRRALEASALAVFVACLACLASACDAPASSSGGPVETCVKVGERCKLEGNKLGVCTMNDSMALFCASQH